MRTKWFLGLVCIFALFSFSGMVNAGLVFDYLIPDRTITVDGNSGDWSGIDPILTHPPGGSTGGPGTSLKAIYLAKDNDYLYWRIDTWDGTFALGNTGDFTGPGIVFYDTHKLSENGGLPIGGVEAFIYGFESGIAARYPGEIDWGHQVMGSGYGAIGTVAEGKIPLSLFNGLDVNALLVWYHGPNENQTYDEASKTFSWFYDKFDGTTINQNKWNLSGLDTRGNIISNDVFSQNGTLQVNGGPQNSTHYGFMNSKATFSGDFDIRVSWANWSYQFGGSWDGCDNSHDGNGCSGPSLGFQILDSTSTSFITLFRNTNNALSGNITTNARINGVWQSAFYIPSEDNLGRFRITREGSTIKSYYYDYTNYSWNLLGSFEGFPTTNVSIQITGYTGYNTYLFHGEFDDVEIVKGTIAQGTISGQVTDANGNGLVNVTVCLVNANNQYLYCGKTDSHGNFSILAPTGSYKVQFNPSQAGQYYLQGWYNNGGFVTVTAGQTISLSTTQLQTGGAISGTVTNSQGVGIANVFVSYWDANNYWYGGSNTDGNGNYTFNAPAGSWKVQFNPPQDGGYYYRKWYNNKLFQNVADFVSVTSGQTTTGINAQLEIGGKISGRVTDSNGNGIANVWVNTIDVTNNMGIIVYSDSNGNYLTTGLAPGNYRVSFNPTNIPGSYYFWEYYYNKTILNAGDPVNVVSGQTTPNINTQLTIGGKISGTVTNSQGTGIANVNVSYCDSTGYCYSGTNTDGNGNYNLNAPAGTWKVMFNPSNAGGYYITQWYNNKSSSATAGSVTVTAGATTPDINATLVQGGAISGKVTSDGTTGIAGVSVGACDQNGNCMYGYGTQTDNNGNYTLNHVPAGSWKVMINPSNLGGYYLSQWYNGQSSSTNATALAVTAGATTYASNVTLTTGGAIKGKVTYQGAGIANVYVGYCDSSNYCYGGTSTNSSGDYTLVAPGGQWKVQFNPSNLGGYYLTGYYNNGGTVTVTAGQPTILPNYPLQMGGAISGLVTDTLGNPLANVDVAIWNSSLLNFLTSGRTKADGSYFIPVLPGTWKVLFIPKFTPGYFAPEWYNNKGMIAYLSDTITVSTIGQPTNLLTAQLKPGGKLSGRLTDGSGSGVYNVNVKVYDLNYNYMQEMGYGFTDSGGNFSFPLPPGNYKVQFASPTNSGLASEWYDNRPFYEESDTITINANQETTVNSQLLSPKTITISGHVKDSNGNGIPGVTLSGLTGPSTLADGSYSGTVSYGGTSWYGSIKPLSDTHIFDPLYRVYVDVNTDQINQDYTSTATQPLIYYDQFSGSDFDPSKWGGWQIREIRDGKLFSKTVGIGVTNTSNRLEFKNFNSINHIEADVTVTEIDGNYGPNAGRTALPSANIAGIFYNDGTGISLSYVGEVQAMIRIRPEQGQLVSEWLVTRYTNSVGSSWDVLQSDILSRSLTLDQTYRLSLDWNPTTNTFSFGDGTNSYSYQVSGITPQPAKVGYKALRTQVNIGDATPSVSDPALWGKVAATFDNVVAKDSAGNTVMSDDFSSAKLDLNKWDTFEISNEISNGQLISKARNGNPYKGLLNHLVFKNPEQISEIQAKVTLQEYVNTSKVSPYARIGGYFFNDTGDTTSGYKGDYWVQVELYSYIPNQSPYAMWSVSRANDTLASSFTTVGYGRFPLPITIGQAYTLYLKWDGKNFTFKCEDNIAYYTPTVPIFQPNNPARILGTTVPSPADLTNFEASITAAFDDVRLGAVGQYTPPGGSIISQPVDPNNGESPATLTFTQVNEAGYTSISTNDPGPPPPAGFYFGEPAIYYEVSTTATYSGDIDISFNYSGVMFNNENNLRLLHYETSGWVDRTLYVDTTNKIIYGRVPSLSPFIIVEIPNRPPVLAPIGNQTVNEGQTLQIVISATDPDGNPLTYSASNLPTGATFDPATQTFSWTPGYDQAGSYQNVLFTVTDNGSPPLSASEPITITVNNVNRPPVLNPIGNKSANEGQLLQFTITATDPDGNPLTYSAGNLPTGATFDSTTRTFSWTPGYDQAGSYPNVIFTVIDNGIPPLSTSEAITITVNNVNRPPILNPIGNKTVNEGDLLRFTITATDPDGDTLSYTAGNLPSGATFNSDTQTFSWLPNYDQAGNYNVLFTVTDNGQPPQSAYENITITVGNVNRPPVLAPIGNKTVNEGQPLTFTITATDPDGDALTYPASNLPTGATFNPATQIFNWTPTYNQAGNYDVTFTATDNGIPPMSDSKTITITVGNVNRPPILNPIGNKTVNEGDTLQFTITATDPDGNALTYSASNLPTGATFSPATQTFSWTPNYDQEGTYSNVLFNVTDNGTPPLSASEAITITVQQTWFEFSPFIIEDAKIDFKKRPDDDKIFVEGKLKLSPKSLGVSSSDQVVITIGLYSEAINHLWTKKRNPDRWEYIRPRGESGIREMTIYWKGNRAEFDVRIDKVELGDPSQWPNPVPITLQIGDDDRGSTAINMRVDKNRWLYHK